MAHHDPTTHNDPATAFDNAILVGRLSDNPRSSRFAGLFMYMGTMNGRDLFKNINTREYLA